MAGRSSNDSDVTRDAFFTRLVHEHSRLLYRVAYSVLRNPEDAEDTVGDALLKLIRSDGWRGITNERAFLARTVWRMALDRFAARSAVSGEEHDDLEVEDEQPSPEDQAVTANERRLLHELIDQLPLELREPLLLVAIEELNSREVGELMHLPEGTVRTRLMRARAALREQYKNQQRNARGREVAVTGA